MKPNCRREWPRVLRTGPVTHGSQRLRLMWGAASFLFGVSCVAPSGVDDESYVIASTTPPLCIANNDGEITRDELPFQSGISVRYRLENGEIPIETAGRISDGTTVWDLSRPDPKDQPIALLAASEIEEHWFAAQFPHADFAAPLSNDKSLWGPLSVEEEGALLHGAASTAELDAANATLLVYDAPVTIYPFPMKKGVRTQSEALAREGILQGIPVAVRDNYDVEVTDVGTLILPDLVLENTLRVTLRLRRTMTVGDTQQISHVFLHECLGEVARIVSRALPLDEPLEDEFLVAQEVRRMSL